MQTPEKRIFRTERMAFRLTLKEKRTIEKMALTLNTNPSGLIRRHFLELFNTKSK
jgi:hypothetical protein